VNSGRDAGGLSASSCASCCVSSSPDSDPSDSSSANGSSSASSLSSTDAGPFESGDRGLVTRGGETAERECWCRAVLRASSSDLSVGRLGVDLDCKPGGTPPLFEEVMSSLHRRRICTSCVLCLADPKGRGGNTRSRYCRDGPRHALSGLLLKAP
jgi:hypothetical protein